MSASNSTRVARHRESLRKQGLRPVQIWVPDTRRADVATELRRQALVVAKSDQNDPELLEFMDTAMDELLNETED